MTCFTGHIPPTPEYEFETIMFEIKVGFLGFVCLCFGRFIKLMCSYVI